MNNEATESKSGLTRVDTNTDAAQELDRENDDPDVRIAVRVPADVHERIRRRAREERLSVNQAIVQAIERYSGSPTAGMRQEIRDLIDVCRLLGAESTSQCKPALAERLKAVYGVELPADVCKTRSRGAKGKHE